MRKVFEMVRTVVGWPAILLIGFVVIRAALRAGSKYGWSGLFEQQLKEEAGREVLEFFEQHPHSVFHAEMLGLLFLVVVGLVAFH